MNKRYKIIFSCLIVMQFVFSYGRTEDLCSICQYELDQVSEPDWTEQQRSIVILPCAGHHKFHAQCFCDYLQSNLRKTKYQLNVVGTRCPMCQEPITTELLIKDGQEQLFCLLADLCPELTHIAHRENPLLIAVQENRPTIVAKIIQKNKQIKQGAVRNALFFASQHGFYDVIDALSRHKKFDATIRDCYGFSPLYYAVTGRHYASVAKLLDVGAPVDELYTCWCYSMRCCVGTAWCGMQKQYADVIFTSSLKPDFDAGSYDWVVREDFSLLHFAYAMADLTLVDLLLSHHADKTITSSRGRLPVHMLAPLHLFINNGGDPNILMCGNVCRSFDVTKYIACKIDASTSTPHLSVGRICLGEYFRVMPQLVGLIGACKSSQDSDGQRAYDYALECYKRASSFSPEAHYYKTLMHILKS